MKESGPFCWISGWRPMFSSFVPWSRRLFWISVIFRSICLMSTVESSRTFWKPPCCACMPLMTPSSSALMQRTLSAENVSICVRRLASVSRVRTWQCSATRLMRSLYCMS